MLHIQCARAKQLPVAVNDFLNLLEKNSIMDTNSLVALTGDINFEESSWANMSSRKD